MKKEVHIWDLPTHKVYIQFKEGFREGFFNRAYEKYGNWRVLGEQVNVRRGDTLIARNWKRGLCCYPLDIILKIGKLIGVNKEEIEKKIIQIKFKTRLDRRGGSSGKPINNPRLPIQINGDFAELLGNICGDGTINGNPKKGIRTAYINSEKALINNFIRKIKKVFGEIEPSVEIRDDPLLYRRPCYFLSYPSIISYILLSVFDYKIGTDIKIPNFIFDMNEKNKCKFMRALFDDEGYVSAKYKFVRIGMKPSKFVNSLNCLLESIGIITRGVKKEGGMNYIKLCDGKNIKLFYKKIGFKHPSKKDRLRKLIKKGWKFERFCDGMTMNKIINLLKNNEEITPKEISVLLNKTPSTIYKHLGNLK